MTRISSKIELDNYTLIFAFLTPSPHDFSEIIANFANKKLCL